MATKYVQATIKVESTEELTDEEAINVALRFDSLTLFFPHNETASIIVYEAVDLDELADIEGDRQQP